MCARWRSSSWGRGSRSLRLDDAARTGAAVDDPPIAATRADGHVGLAIAVVIAGYRDVAPASQPHRGHAPTTEASALAHVVSLRVHKLEARSIEVADRSVGELYKNLYNGAWSSQASGVSWHLQRGDHCVSARREDGCRVSDLQGAARRRPGQLEADAQSRSRRQRNQGPGRRRLVSCLLCREIRRSDLCVARLSEEDPQNSQARDRYRQNATAKWNGRDPARQGRPNGVSGSECH
jgi:hypothetical protein